jgi:hypothetical protein
VKATRQELYEKAERIIGRARKQTKMLMKTGFIRPRPKA